MSKMNFAVFIAGAALGAAAALICLRKRYERIAQEEIDSVKTAFAKRKSEPAAEEQDEKQRLAEYFDTLREEGYVNYSEHSKNDIKEKKENSMSDKPYCISPEEYGENEDYTQISLTYYSDGILADDGDEIMTDIERTVGSDFAEHFGDYEDDSVFIRNDSLECDYEILKDNRSYSEIVGV